MSEIEKIKIGYSIQTARVQKGWTQEELAQKAGIDRNTIIREEERLNKLINEIQTPAFFEKSNYQSRLFTEYRRTL